MPTKVGAQNLNLNLCGEEIKQRLDKMLKRDCKRDCKREETIKKKYEQHMEVCFHPAMGQKEFCQAKDDIYLASATKTYGRFETIKVTFVKVRSAPTSM